MSADQPASDDFGQMAGAIRQVAVALAYDGGGLNGMSLGENVNVGAAAIATAIDGNAGALDNVASSLDDIAKAVNRLAAAVEGHTQADPPESDAPESDALRTEAD
jgi:methyl-accepting chemotaxis protein